MTRISRGSGIGPTGSGRLLHAKEHAMSLNGKVAIVTGSGQGLGLAYARELARQGAAVVVNDVNPGTAAEAVALIEADGGRATAVVAPGGTTDAAKALVAGAVEAFGRLDILVTNAGILRDKSLLKMTDEDFDLVINVHLKGTFTCVREAFAYFKDNNVAGRAITLASPRRSQGRNRLHCPNVGDGNEEGRSNGEHCGPCGGHCHDQDRSLLPEGGGG